MNGDHSWRGWRCSVGIDHVIQVGEVVLRGDTGYVDLVIHVILGIQRGPNGEIDHLPRRQVPGDHLTLIAPQVQCEAICGGIDRISSGINDPRTRKRDQFVTLGP